MRLLFPAAGAAEWKIFMKNCNNCGAEIDEGSIYCPYCGARYDTKAKKENKQEQKTCYGGSYDPRYGYIPDYGSYDVPSLEGRSAWVAVLSFILPIVGLILWHTWKYSKPGKSASAANGALAGVSFAIPLAGAFFWYTSRYRNPQHARSCGIAAVLGVVFTIVYTIVAYVLYERFGIVIFI